MRSTHVITSNGDMRFELGGLMEPAEMIHRALSQMDGEEVFAFSVARLPDGLTLADRLPEGWPHSYLQSAGTAQAMTLEMRTAHDADGVVANHVVVGRAGGEAGPAFTITWPGGSQVVAANETFTAEEATRVYLRYVELDAVPDGYVTRPLVRA